MFNNRMLAVAAVLALAVPALGAAAPVVVTTPMQEQLVEGHTVFTVIEANRTEVVNGVTRYAAAVAVLVREYAAENRNVRFPGVLWFNDQYLVNPESQANENARYRYPCGGAIMAVNRGDPDPRMALAQVRDGNNVLVPGDDQYNNVNVTFDSANPTTPPTVNSDATGSSLAHNNFNGIFGVSYQKTYQITDPNDHYWVIDKYTAYQRSTPASFGITSVYSFPVWVVNVMGGPVFVPDDGSLNCYPFYDTAYYPIVGNTTKSLTCGGTPAGTVYGGQLSAQDRPCKGYKEPSSTGYCYSGGPTPTAGCGASPVRLYNGLLYFELQDLDDPGAARTHNSGSTDTNGCHVGTEWSCPGGDDNAEGNSHPFHPATHAGSGDVGPCQPTAAGQTNAPTNHGGSTTATAPPSGSASYGPAACDLVHATRDIDIYFSPSGRPARPPLTVFGQTLGNDYGNAGNAEADTQGSSAPFHDTPSAYGTTH